MVLDKSWTHLACADQFVVSEFSQLGPQGQVRIHQEGLPATLVEVLERQSCAQSTISTLICQTSVNMNNTQTHLKLNICLPVYEGLSLFSS